MTSLLYNRVLPLPFKLVCYITEWKKSTPSTLFVQAASQQTAHSAKELFLFPIQWKYPFPRNLLFQFFRDSQLMYTLTIKTNTLLISSTQTCRVLDVHHCSVILGIRLPRSHGHNPTCPKKPLTTPLTKTPRRRTSSGPNTNRTVRIRILESLDWKSNVDRWGKEM